MAEFQPAAVLKHAPDSDMAWRLVNISTEDGRDYRFVWKIINVD
jgi:hypothetical protein